tara:strand:+ start:13298 stop:13558 length:261 start_codon:yes stop_codon:yes gene_type:complete
MVNSVLPNPKMYPDWERWAGALVQKLRGVEEVTIPDMMILTVAQVREITPDIGRGLVYISDEVGGAVPAFADGTNWRRVTDRAVVS